MKLSNMISAVALAWAGAGLAWAPLIAKSGASEDEKGTVTRNLFSSHCIQCHGKDGKVKGKVDLLKYSSDGDLRDDPELLQAVLDAIDFGEMPPEDEKQIPLPIRDSALTHLQALLLNMAGGTGVRTTQQNFSLIGTCFMISNIFSFSC